MVQAYLSLGTNLGDRAYYLARAVEALTEHPAIQVLARSSIYETEPWGLPDQPQFWNLVLQVETDLPPLELLKFCQHIETELGRKRLVRWGPRTIDIDILLYDNISSDLPELTLPHPRMEERAFVLIPLREIAPQLRLPSGHLITELTGEGQVRKLPGSGGHP